MAIWSFVAYFVAPSPSLSLPFFFLHVMAHIFMDFEMLFVPIQISIKNSIIASCGWCVWQLNVFGSGTIWRLG